MFGYVSDRLVSPISESVFEPVLRFLRRLSIHLKTRCCNLDCFEGSIDVFQRSRTQMFHFSL